MKGATHSLLLLLVTPFVAACSRHALPPPPTSVASTTMDPSQAAASPQVAAAPIRFVDVSAAAGMQWQFNNGATGRHFFVETTGGGVALLDFNNDGRLDLFAVQGGPVPVEGEARFGASEGSLPRFGRGADSGGVGRQRRGPSPGAQEQRFPVRNALYRAEPGGQFTDVTAGSGLEVPCGYGQGVAAADYDNDGWTDLYVTAYGGNHLFRNNGDGIFTDVTQRADVADRAAEMPWPLSAAWGDYDNDGRLDLFVCHYVRWSRQRDRKCPRADGQLAYCRPQVYEGSHSRLYHNEGKARFRDVTGPSGVGRLMGKSMGAAWIDEDGDGWMDLFVSNDTTPNYLLRNNRDGTFTDRALMAGVAVGPSGEPLSGMGIGVGDYDRDGRVDLALVNFAGQPKTLYQNQGNGFFIDRSYASNLASSDLQFLGFGMESLDYDLDGYLDLVYGNGHVLDNPEVLSSGATYAQSQQLFHNQRDGTFAEDRRSLGDLVNPRVTRGLAVGDVDNDGDPDVALGAQNGPLQLFLNEGGNRSGWIAFRLEGVRGNRDAVGAKLTIAMRQGRQTAWVHGGSSYCSHSDRRVTFGLGTEGEIQSLEVRWSGGRVQQFGRMPGQRFYWVREGQKPVPDLRISSRPETRYARFPSFQP